MASLLEIADSPRQVEVRGKKIDVYGVSGRGLAALFTRFPDIGKAFAGADLDRDAIVKVAPEALAAVIAAGTGHGGDEKAERVAGQLGVAEQLDLLEEIMRLTFPKGVGPFVAKLQGIGLLANVEDAPEAPAASPPLDAQSKS